MIGRRMNCLVATVLIGHATGVAQPGPTQAPTTVPTGCTTSGCHTDVKSFTVLHGPNAVDACDACHVLADAAKHSFSLTRPANNLCTFCHEAES